MPDYTDRFAFIGRLVDVEIDRPMGSRHPTSGDVYPLNYGFVPGVIAPDGEALDAYVLGVFAPVKRYTGRCIGVVHRADDEDDKLVLAPDGRDFSDAQIMALTEFQEHVHDVSVVRTAAAGRALLARAADDESAGTSGPSAAYFARRACAALPVEAPYAYHERLRRDTGHEPCRDADAAPEAGEVVFDESWSIVVPEAAGEGLRFAARDLRDFLHAAMGVRVAADTAAAPPGAAVVAGSAAQLRAMGVDVPDLGADLRGAKDYEIRVVPGGDIAGVVVCGFDEAGAMFGLLHLEERLRLRGGPFLPGDLRSVRHSVFRTRAAMSWLGWMQWPDALLAHMARDGFDAIFASVYANPNGVPGPPHYDIIRTQDADRLRDVIRRAGAHGLKVYCPILWANTGTPENEAGLRAHVRDIVTTFPEIRGYVLLTEGFYYKAFFGAGGHGDTDLKDWARRWTRAVGIVAEECHALDAQIEILPWEYNIDFRPNRVELKRFVTSLLPADTIPLLTWENGTGFDLGGLRGFLRDYSLTCVGPAEVAAGQIETAKSRGMAVYCKVDTFATWQFGTSPYIPAPQQWQRRYDALAAHGVDGTLETWSNGYKPNFVARLRAWSSWTEPLPHDELLRATARRLFGAGQEDLVVDAWARFSDAVQLVPDTGPSMGTNSAVAQPLFLEEPPARIMTLHNSWWDEDHKFHWRHRVVDAWPYAHRIMVFLPDFTNTTNRAEEYARARSGVGALEPPERLAGVRVLDAFNRQLRRAAETFEAGLRLYRQAALAAPADRREAALKEVLIVEQMRRMLESLHAILEFEDLRFRLSHTQDRGDAGVILERMEAIVEEEVPRTEAALEAARRDSRLGYEAEMDYAYSPWVIEEKLRLLRRTLSDELPRRRQACLSPYR